MRRALAAALLAVLSQPAVANDSMAELGIGGLTLTTTANVETSLKARVGYRFNPRRFLTYGASPVTASSALVLR